MALPVVLLAALPALLAPQSQAIPPPVHPDTEEGFARALGLRTARLLRLEGLEVWTDEGATGKRLEKPVREAWDLSRTWFGGPVLPDGMVVRAVVLQDRKALAAYQDVLAAEAARLGAPAPHPDFTAAVVETGSGLWTWPPVLLVSTQALGKDEVVSRVVHDLGVVLARYAACPWGADPPEFLAEGFAGMLLRHAVKRPVPLVSHENAALAERIYGYGVFAGIGAALNDNSNDPTTWPGILRAAVKKMRRDGRPAPGERLDALLLRSRKDFARTDYAYAWAVMEFLFDDREPYGEAARSQAEARRPARRSEEPLAESRRTGLLRVLAELRKPEHARLDAAGRSSLFRELLLETYGETPEQLHEAFMSWVERSMPKK